MSTALNALKQRLENTTIPFDEVFDCEFTKHVLDVLKRSLADQLRQTLPLEMSDEQKNEIIENATRELENGVLKPLLVQIREKMSEYHNNLMTHMKQMIEDLFSVYDSSLVITGTTNVTVTVATPSGPATGTGTGTLSNGHST